MQLNYIIPTSGQKQAQVHYFLWMARAGHFFVYCEPRVSYVLTETRWQKLRSYVVLFKLMKYALDTAKWMSSSINKIKMHKALW